MLELVPPCVVLLAVNHGVDGARAVARALEAYKVLAITGAVATGPVVPITPTCKSARVAQLEPNTLESVVPKVEDSVPVAAVTEEAGPRSITTSDPAPCPPVARTPRNKSPEGTTAPWAAVVISAEPAMASSAIDIKLVNFMRNRRD